MVVKINESLDEMDIEVYGVYFTEAGEPSMFLFENEEDALNALYELQDFSEYLESISKNGLSLDSDEYDSRLENILVDNNASDVQVIDFSEPGKDMETISVVTDAGENLDVVVVNREPVELI